MTKQHPGFSPQHVLILYNQFKDKAECTALKTRDYLTAHGISAEIFQYHPNTGQQKPSWVSHVQSFEVVIVLGGDGTILGVAREIAEDPRPVLGVNLGNFGFLTTSATHELHDTLQKLIAGQYRIQSRYLLEAKVIRTTHSDEEVVFRSRALNEALVTLVHPGRLVEIWVGEDEESALRYRADGLIVATPTGSTGHSLSAGGPILEPHLAALIMTPVSPHSLFNRPLVFGGEKELRIWFKKRPDELVLILDGQIHKELRSNDVVILQRSKKIFPTIMMPSRSFSQVLQYKFNLGETP